MSKATQEKDNMIDIGDSVTNTSKREQKPENTTALTPPSPSIISFRREQMNNYFSNSVEPWRTSEYFLACEAYDQYGDFTVFEPFWQECITNQPHLQFQENAIATLQSKSSAAEPINQGPSSSSSAYYDEKDREDSEDGDDEENDAQLDELIENDQPDAAVIYSRDHQTASQSQYIKAMTLLVINTVLEGYLGPYFEWRTQLNQLLLNSSRLPSELWGEWDNLENNFADQVRDYAIELLDDQDQPNLKSSPVFKYMETVFCYGLFPESQKTNDLIDFAKLKQLFPQPVSSAQSTNDIKIEELATNSEINAFKKRLQLKISEADFDSVIIEIQQCLIDDSSYFGKNPEILILYYRAYAGLLTHLEDDYVALVLFKLEELKRWESHKSNAFPPSFSADLRAARTALQECLLGHVRRKIAGKDRAKEWKDIELKVKGNFARRVLDASFYNLLQEIEKTLNPAATSTQQSTPSQTLPAKQEPSSLSPSSSMPSGTQRKKNQHQLPPLRRTSSHYFPASQGQISLFDPYASSHSKAKPPSSSLSSLFTPPSQSLSSSSLVSSLSSSSSSSSSPTLISLLQQPSPSRLLSSTSLISQSSSSLFSSPPLSTQPSSISISISTSSSLSSPSSSTSLSSTTSPPSSTSDSNFGLS